ncbi:hypothetical protein [Bacillus cereus]|uniref:hypothetical protein n=1 Tax=Bacillus cereus TaxID=1396 RepID=UPI003D175FBD
MTPIKDVGEFICVFGLDTKEVIDILANYFRRDLVVNSTCYVWDLERRSLQRVKLEGPTERITIRFKQGTYEKINALAYALDVTPSKATALLLEVSLKDSNVINRYVKSYLKETLDGKRLKELKKIVKFINDHNPYDEEFSWTEFMSYMFEGMKNQSKSMKDTLNDWIDKYK